MYSAAESSKIRQDFWTVFGQYMKPVPSAQGYRINWQNYKTGVKDVYFRMKTERDFISIGIEICNKDDELQQLYFEQFVEFRKLLEAELEEPWDWQLHQFDDLGKVVSRIQKVKIGLNVFDQNDWPEIISFLKPRIIALDAFWANIKPAFEDL
jgi:hypothetical protein